MAGTVIKIYRCPSDPKGPLLPNGSNVPGGIQVMRPSYVAIAGAVDRLDQSGLFRERRMTVNGWSLGFTLPSGQNITGGWNATYSPTSGAVTARNVSYNGTIAPNASVGIGFQATHTGNTAKPTSFTLNGAACAAA